MRLNEFISYFLPTGKPTTEGLKAFDPVVIEPPEDGLLYGYKDGDWIEVAGGGGLPAGGVIGQLIVNNGPGSGEWQAFTNLDLGTFN